MTLGADLILQGHSLGGVKGGITKHVRKLTDSKIGFIEVLEEAIFMKKSNDLSFVREYYNKRGYTKNAVNLITKGMEDDDKIEDKEFRQVLEINENANIPAGTWVNWSSLNLWVESQWIGDNLHVVSSAYADYSSKIRERNLHRKRTKHSYERYTYDKKYQPKFDDLGNQIFKALDKKSIKSFEEFLDDFLSGVTFAIQRNIHDNGSKQHYKTYTDKETGVLIKIQHFNGSEHWMAPHYKELYKHVDEEGMEWE